MSVLREGLGRYLSPAALKTLGCARIGIAGAGGLGSNVAMLLLRSGIRHFVLVDRDRVEASNLNRQFYWPEDVGKRKVEALGSRLTQLEPGADCRCHAIAVNASNAVSLFSDCDVVVEALDEAGQKAEFSALWLGAGYYVVAASGLGGYGLPPMQVRNLGKTFVCVGDFATAADADAPPLAPRVMQAAALQADAVLARILISKQN